MLDILQTEKSFILAHLKEGDTAADFTMGNGHDTLFLSQTVGESGKVYAFDIQPAALENTKKRLAENGAPENYVLINDSHHNLKKYIDRPIKAGMFNLGYLPGGDKSVTTLRDTTLAAVNGALDLLAPDGILLIAVYPGHKEGEIEGDMLADLLSTLDRKKYCCVKFRIINSPSSSYFYIIESK
ncbi:MAG: methyltransferase domain-containing protein [Clostridia bacterium]|nr:methyltransferase domain-containing protein [Clostridia bacterium]